MQRKILSWYCSLIIVLARTNRYIFQILSLLVRVFQSIKSVTLMFLEGGHTQNENDSIHSAVEKSKKGTTVNHP